jgi:hypothetical protein
MTPGAKRRLTRGTAGKVKVRQPAVRHLGDGVNSGDIHNAACVVREQTNKGFT